MKLDSSFPNAQFQVEGYKMYRKDRYLNGGGLIKSDLTSRLRSDLETETVESTNIELNLGSSKWLVMGAYKPPSMKPETFNLDLQKF